MLEWNLELFTTPGMSDHMLYADARPKWKTLAALLPQQQHGDENDA